MKFDKIIIKNYKCFNDIGCVIEGIKSVNVIIGKNNSGKSSLIETIKFLTDGDKDFLDSERNMQKPEISFEHIITPELVNEFFMHEKNSAHKSEIFSLVFSTLTYTVAERLDKKFLKVNKEFRPNTRNDLEIYARQLISPLQRKQFRHLSAERDIQPEQQNSQMNVSANGTGATNLIQSIINHNDKDSNLVEVKLLQELNKILNPDIEFTRILVQQNVSQIWEIYFESKFDGRVPLSKMGSGVKTVLLVLILLHITPGMDQSEIGNYVFALEELENNLHPSLQRRLYNYLFKFSQKNKCILFLTTHSNVVIDLYSSLEDTQIFHIKKNDGITSITSVFKQDDAKAILDDLEFKASDILQSNGIIWVEGPSDRTYLNKWIRLIDKTLIEGYHYSIMFYGGRLLANLSLDYECLNKELIPLLKLNTNAFVVMDRDGIDDKVNKTKSRIQSEIGDNNVWITKGREIENYLTSETIENWLLQKHQITGSFLNELNVKIEDSILKVNTLNKLKYNLNKSKYASEIIGFIKDKDLESLDLKNKVIGVVEEIRKWNKINIPKV